MQRKWISLAVVTSFVIALGTGASLAGDDAETPLDKIMKKANADLKVIRNGTASAPKFKRARSGKDVAVAAEDLAKLGPVIRAFKEYAEKFKKPYSKWTDMTDTYIETSKAMAKAAATGECNEARRAWTRLNTSCNTCHGAFRPSNNSDDF